MTIIGAALIAAGCVLVGVAIERKRPGGHLDTRAQLFAAHRQLTRRTVR